MTALVQARHLRALADKLRAGGLGKQSTRPDPDTCGMPLGEQRCGLPADHDDGCAARVTCLCSHADVLHDEAGCRIFVCGCRVLRAKGGAA